jgi:hypothetical protein
VEGLKTPTGSLVRQAIELSALNKRMRGGFGARNRDAVRLNPQAGLDMVRLPEAGGEG